MKLFLGLVIFAALCNVKTQSVQKAFEKIFEVLSKQYHLSVVVSDKPKDKIDSKLAIEIPHVVARFGNDKNKTKNFVRNCVFLTSKILKFYKVTFNQKFLRDL